MKLATIATIVAATAGIVAAQPHRHAHNHLHKREVVTVYELDGRVIPAAEVKEGIANGTYVWDVNTGKVSSPIKISDAPAAAPKVNVAAHSDKAAVSPPAAPKAAPAVAPQAADLSTENTSVSTSGKGATTPFPNGEISCSTFPSDYGAINVPWVGLGGWTGVQQPQSGAAGFSNIMTMTSDLCNGADCCKEGAYCSYACAPGFQKSQWPTTQGSTGQSVGGLLCQNGKLQLTNPSAHTLCIPGNTVVDVQIKNTMGKSAAVCRTDYPGTEGETVPLNAAPGTTTPLTTPDGDSYYHWQGGATSAQYYVNPAGVPVEQACQWGSSANPWGNFAPLNIGAGYSDGAAWLSIFQNLPTTDAKLDYTVELVGDNGGFDNFVGKCKYSGGQYCSGDNYENCSSDGKGCTVNVKSGSATFVFSSP